MVDAWQTISRYSGTRLTLFGKSQIWSKTPDNILKMYPLKWSNNWVKDSTVGILGATHKTTVRDPSELCLVLWSV